MGLKERCPIDYMADIEDHFYKATGLHLNGLRSFTAWIKQGSYYHRLVARQGCLHECQHLVGVPLPRWPQVTPSESCWESQMKSDAQITSSSKPSVGATVAPVAETPVAPVMETLGAEAPAAPSDTPAPMETGRAGDGQSWAKRVVAGTDEGFQRARPVKHPGPNPGGMSQDPHFPSPSKTVRGGSPPFCSSTSMQQSSLSPPTTWLVEG